MSLSPAAKIIAAFAATFSGLTIARLFAPRYLRRVGVTDSRRSTVNTSLAGPPTRRNNNYGFTE